jgi:hypothetical protein
MKGKLTAVGTTASQVGSSMFVEINKRKIDIMPDDLVEITVVRNKTQKRLGGKHEN